MTHADLTVLYEDNHCLALVKPAGVLTQGPAGVESLEGLAKAYLAEKYKKRGKVYLGVPHRLDRPVSGVVLFARQTLSARRLAEQFRERKVKKVYRALVERTGDEWPPESGTWEDWLVKIADQGRGEIAIAGAPGAKQAVLRYRRLRVGEEGALLEIEPETGRMHQIRIQAAARGWPVRGDGLYGAKTRFGPSAEQERDRIIALHARSLTFLHPVRYEAITVTAASAGDWAETQ